MKIKIIKTYVLPLIKKVLYFIKLQFRNAMPNRGYTACESIYGFSLRVPESVSL